MQLYKTRDFGALFQDTFSFIKLHGKHFFKHFIIINGLPVIILTVLIFLFSKFYTELVSGSITRNNPNGLDQYINENVGVFAVVVILLMIFALGVSLMTYVYPPLYLNLYEKKGGTDFTTQEILKAYKNNLGKLIIFVLCCFLISIPMLILMALIFGVLVITIVGILAIPLAIGGFMLFYQMTFMEYLQNKKGIWNCFGYSWTLLTSKFWVVIGSVGIFYFISYILQQIVGLIPYIFGMASFFATIEDGTPNAQEVASTMSVILIATLMLSFIVSIILNAFTQLNQGIAYYSLKEENENINTRSEIDQIGSSEN